MVEADGRIPEVCDVAVIGAGAGGLTAAALLAKAGLRTVVFESSEQVGGYLAGFQRQGFHFNSSIEWLNHCAPGGFVYNIFHHLGADFPECPSQKYIRRFKSDSFDYLLSSDPKELCTAMIRDFPGDRQGIRDFFRDAELLGERLRLIDLKVQGRETMTLSEKVRHGIYMFFWLLPIIKHLRNPVDKGLRRYFRCGAQNIFNSQESLMGIMVLIAWASSGNIQSSPRGGSRVIAKWLHDRIIAAGSMVVLNRRVQQVLLDKRQQACGILLADGQRVSSRFVIAACDLQVLYEKMLPPGNIPARLLKNLRNADLYNSYFSIFIGLSCDPASLGFGDETLHLTRTDVCRAEQSSGDPHLTMITVNAPSLRDSSLAPPGKGTLTIHCPAYFDYADRWQTGEGYVRGEAYRRCKEAFADILLKRIEKCVAPRLRDHIEVMEIATPMTYWRYTGNTKGSISGSKPTGRNIRAGVAHCQTPVRNLLVGGHCGEYGGGVPMAVKAAANASLIVMDALVPSAGRELKNLLNGACR